MSDKHNGLAYSVQVDGEWYRPGDQEIPAKVAAQIGDHVWEGGVHPNPTARAKYLKARDGRHSTPSDNDGGGSEPGGNDGDGPPPMSGTGSGTEAWAEYATKHGVTVPPETKREDIIAALRDAGIAVEPAGD